MRVSRDEMERSHRRIVEGASRLMRERGMVNTSVADVMNDAGMTHGGFYRHFKTKDALAAAALQAAFDQAAAKITFYIERGDPNGAAQAFREDYLSEAHVDGWGNGCPLPALGADVARESDALKRAFGAGVSDLVEMLAKAMGGSGLEGRMRATRELALLAGAVMLARASDPQTARSILAACRSA